MTTIQKTFAVCLALFSIATVNAKEKDGVIMRVDGESVPSEEFLYLFHKNNQQQSQPQTLEEYLDLFKIYRLKVAEAKAQGVDTLSSFRKEMETYRRELLEPYIEDSTLLENMIDIALDRENTRVESSHIMIIRTHNPEVDARNVQMLDSLHTVLLNGGDFIEIAKNYSQDKFSADKGGYLGFAPAGAYPYGFETAVYETPEGEISEIVESHVGWHIVKSGARKEAKDFNQPIKTRDQVKADVMRKITSPFDPRYHQIRQNVIKKLNPLHPEVNVNGLNEEDAYSQLISAEEKRQYKENPEYRNLVDEYVNGSMLYEVSVANVWNPASNDLEALESFYNENRGKYTWDKPHAKGLLVQTQNDSIAAVIKENIQGLSIEEIIPLVKEKYKNIAYVEKFNVTEGTNPMIDQVVFGGAEAKPKFKNFPVFFAVCTRIIEEPEELNDVKASVVNDYQEVLEAKWVADLQRKHKVEVNAKELKNLKKRAK